MNFFDLDPALILVVALLALLALVVFWPLDLNAIEGDL